MPAKKKMPTLRWKQQPKKWYNTISGTTVYKLEQWDDSKNKYVDIPEVE